MKLKIINILLPLPFNQTFQYLCNEDEKIELGSFVSIPFKNKIVTGCIWENKSKLKKRLPKKKIRNIEKKLNFSPLNKNNRDFIVWVSDYTMNNLGATLKLCLSIKQIFKKKKIEKIKDQSLNLSSDKFLLTKEQLNAKKYIFQKIDNKKFSTVVIDGVAGSGKTEVYFEAINKCLMEKKQILVLLPEISMTTQWLDRFKKKFKANPLLWHSDIKGSEKIKIWKSILEDNVNIVVGARSSLFLPFKNLGLIIIDEEHDQSFKQEEGIIYNARDMAISRGSFEKTPVLLITSIPSVETFNNIIKKKYSTSKLNKRYQDASMPNLEIINLNNKKISNKNWIANETMEKVNRHLQRGDQVLFFLNRRGFAPFVICKKCHNKFLCPNCSVNLNYHKSKNFLLCHYCGYKNNLNKICKDNKPCEFIMCGPGVERIAEELEQKYPDKKIQIFSSDTLNKKKTSEDLIEKIENKKIDILVGTQLISKGFHFSKLNCVVVVDADFSSHGYDLRSAEKNIQLYHQLSGRAGREGSSSTIYFQTYTPDDEILLNISKKNPHQFLLNEIELRKKNKLPPFYRFISIIITGKNEKQTINEALKVKNQITKDIKEEILGPVNAPIFKLNQKYRCRLLLRSKKNILIQKKLAKILKKIKIYSGIKLTVDVDPITFN